MKKEKKITMEMLLQKMREKGLNPIVVRELKLSNTAECCTKNAVRHPRSVKLLMKYEPAG